MRILRIQAHDFGKLSGSLDLAGGLTVVHGTNEAGKSTWLQAIFAGLCGRRRGRGANTLEEREFERQYEPWNGRPWRVTVKLQLDDGRPVEIQQRDLKAKESVAHDADTGRPIGDELIYRGSIDGSRFLGLNRQVMPSTLVIGQGDIQRLRQKKGDEASALREELQRAAASAGGAATAAEALSRLKKYAREQVGPERRNSTRPLQQAIQRLTRAGEELERGRERHQERAELEDELKAARDRTDAATILVRRCEHARTKAQLDQLETTITEIDQLAERFPDGRPPPRPTEGPDSATAKELREAAFEYRRRPEAPTALEGPSAEHMARELAELPDAAQGDRDIAPEVAEAAGKWRETRQIRAVRERLGPGDPPTTSISPTDEPTVRRALATLELPPLEPQDEMERRVHELTEKQTRYQKELEANSGFGKWPWWGAIAGGLVGVLSNLEVLPRMLGLGGYVVMLVSFLLIFRAQRRTPSPNPDEQRDRNSELGGVRMELWELQRAHKRRNTQLETAARDLASLGLEPAADAVRDALDALRQRERWDWDHASWKQRLAAARKDEAKAEQALRTALAGRGVDDAETAAADLLDSYERDCRRNLALAAGTNQREALNARIEARRQVEQAATRQRKQREMAEARFRDALTAAGFPADSAADPEQWASDWLHQREHRLGRLRTDWERLQGLLKGRTRQSLAGEREATAARLQSAAGADSAFAEFEGMSSDAVEWKLAEARNEAADAGNQASNFEGRLAAEADLPSLAELEEEQATAESDVELLRLAGSILETAQEHLEAAQDEVHRMLAPDLREALTRRLRKVTAGRYTNVRIDPEDGLEVRLEVEEGIYRPATELSHGTVDQVYLLLRIALAEALGDRTESAPLFLDDATVHCDTERTMRFLELLLELSAERQIVVFSQEEEVREWAAARLAAHKRNSLIELGPNGLPVITDDDTGLVTETTAASDPEEQRSLL
ncbi:MAG: AAA family ATPase [Acidobacteria bacterium]|nr:AAA family ATPase [Acidobacteriota bacterium]